ncbi:MAG: dihydropteroate synthase [Prevotellaceae bacterium]|jgi:5-methyltetrahydrofolate--homocysteine methyltransferase|nr:dihydropteroate synthase [Prevotellaceae bacterium]
MGVGMQMIKNQHTFINIGERTNVAGSAKFARLIREKNYDEAVQIAKNQIINGASIIDINLDDAMIDSAAEMETFVRILSNDADVAKAAFMIDSSDWNTILAGLKNFQGKSIVNSISLKDGEEIFLRKALEIKRLGAAVIIMAFDEKGQAATFERKIEICQRAYNLLTQRLDYEPYNIIFDANILTIGTGIEEHNNYAVDFIEAVRWIKNNLKGALTSGGVSNLSFSFRGNNAVREAMHSAFLYHSIAAGLDMAIVNPAMLQIYDDIPKNLLQAVENMIFNRKKNATEELILLAEKIKNEIAGQARNDSDNSVGTKKISPQPTDTVEKRLENALRFGNSENLEQDLREALQKYSSAVEIIEQPLMNAMDKIGELFGEGKMFLPQVIKSAKVMKNAIEILQPEIERQNLKTVAKKRPKILIATAKGDIHDIGKNILSIVLSCSNFEVVDLGIMIENQAIIDATKLHKPDIVGVSGLITPSLSEMADLCQMLENEQLNIPFFVGGAAASAVHTAVKLAPLYSFGVFHGGNASASTALMKKYLQNPQLVTLQNAENQQYSREKYLAKKEKLATFAESQNKKPVFEKASFIQNENFGALNIFCKNMNISVLENFIEWNEFLHFWFASSAARDVGANNYTAGADFQSVPETQRLNLQNRDSEKEKLLAEAKNILKTEKNNFEVSYIVEFFDACSIDNQIVLHTTNNTAKNETHCCGLEQSNQSNNDREEHCFPMFRQQNNDFLSLADYFPDKKLKMRSKIGLFCVSADYIRANNFSLLQDEKSYEYLLKKTLCARLAEACSKLIQSKTRANNNSPLLAPAFGYAVCPDHSLKRDTFDILRAEQRIGVQLSDTYGITPSTSICGMLIAHPQAKYFNIHSIDNEQFTYYATARVANSRQQIDEDKLKKILGHLL